MAKADASENDVLLKRCSRAEKRCFIKRLPLLFRTLQRSGEPYVSRAIKSSPEQELPMSIAVRTDISPSLHPAVVAALPGYDDETKEFVSEVERTFAQAYEAVAKVNDARKGAESNPTLNVAARVLVVADYADQHQSRILPKFDAASANLQRAIASMEQSLNGPIEGAAVGGFTAEVRAYAKSLSRADRTALIADAMSREDTKTLAAILGAPAYLSGLSEAERNMHTRKFHERKQPGILKRLELMKGALGLLNERSPLIFGAMEEAVGANRLKVDSLRAAKMNAERAFAP